MTDTLMMPILCENFNHLRMSRGLKNNIVQDNQGILKIFKRIRQPPDKFSYSFSAVRHTGAGKKYKSTQYSQVQYSSHVQFSSTDFTKLVLLDPLGPTIRHEKGTLSLGSYSISSIFQGKKKNETKIQNLITKR